MSDYQHWTVKVAVLAIWFVSVYVHEVGHAAAAYWGGDREVGKRGGFSPIRMWLTNPVMTFVLPAIILLMAGFAFPGAATRIDRERLRGKWTVTLVYLAGPAASVVVTLVMAGLYHAMPEGLVRWILAFSILLSVMSTLLNLLPVPSLDGFGAIGPHLPARVEKWAFRLALPLVIGLFVFLIAYRPAGLFVQDVCMRGAELLGVAKFDLERGLWRFMHGMPR